MTIRTEANWRTIARESGCFSTIPIMNGMTMWAIDTAIIVRHIRISLKLING